MLGGMVLRYLIAVLCLMTLPLMAQGHGGCADGVPSGEASMTHDADPYTAQHHASSHNAREQHGNEHAASDQLASTHDCGDCDTLCLIQCSTTSALTVSVLQWQRDTVDIFSEHRHFPPLAAHTSPLLRPPSLILI
ncbi:MAG: hypothetical protein LAT61_03485 [Alcanivorax sp.]|nr:hypothetical protein [Alcanivorax sp.]